MVMENDEFIIPEQYCRMSVTMLEEEADKVFKEIKSKPREIGRKKKCVKGHKDITFNL